MGTHHRQGCRLGRHRGQPSSRSRRWLLWRAKHRTRGRRRRTRGHRHRRGDERNRRVDARRALRLKSAF